MKNAKLLLISLASLLLLTACGGQSTEPVGKIDEEPSQVEQPDTAPAEAETPDAGPSLDNGWASDDFEAQLPALPFSGWSVVKTTDENEYRIYAEDVLYTDAKAYSETLPDHGFQRDIIIYDDTGGLNYYFNAENENGYEISFDFNAYSSDQPITGLLDITLRRTAASGAQTAEPSEDDATAAAVQSSDDLAAQLPTLPDGDWVRSDGEYGNWMTCELYCEQLSLEDAKAYADALEAAGFGRNAVRDENGGEFIFEGYTSGEPLTMVTVQCGGEGYAFITLQIAKG